MNQLPMILRPAVRKGPRYSVRPFYTTLLVFAALVALSWAVRSNIIGQSPRRTTTNVLLARRENEPECRQVRDVKDQCAYIHANCPDHEDGLLSYLQLYYCTLADAKPLAFTILILWLSLLFSTIGIAASDFLCIDLSTLASILGLSESLTGVTFLAFGNGSPDVFSTFAAMRSNSGSLAIGELIGAASFITSVVAGSMALVRPFKVARRSFVRDIGYFVVAVTFSMFLLADGRLHVWESAAMVGLYVFYVFMVVTWHWYLVRRRRKYERDLAARTHFHIPDNQELDVEEPIEDDDPGVASESRSLLRGASTDDFDLLERTEGIPLWKEQEDEDDETRNRYLAEISDNMHVYRPPNRSRRNTMNPIRPSLVGALEFQSVLHSLQKSRNTNINPTISLSSYSDDGENSQAFDTRSIASHPRATRPSTTNDRLSPQSASGSSRVRAVSANDADGLQIDTSVLGRHTDKTPRLTVRRPSNEAGDSAPFVAPELPRIDTSAELTASPSSSAVSSTCGSPVDAAAPQTPDLLAPPGAFQSPNYLTGATHDRSPAPVSPRGGSSLRTGLALESPSAPFPAFIDMPSRPSSRPPSIRLPYPASPSEPFLVHDSINDIDNDNNASLRNPFKRFWPYSVLPAPSHICCTLFPTLAGWKSKNFMERCLGIVAAPSVFLLTITVPVIEPHAPESLEPDMIPAVVVDEFNDNANPAPRVMLPADSPLQSPILLGRHDSVPHVSVSNSHRKSTIQDPTSRPRWDSELPAAPPVMCEPSTPARDWNRWLVIMQLFTGPFFFVLIAWSTLDEDLNPRNLLFPTLVSLLFSFIFLSLLLTTTRRRPWHRQAFTDPASQQRQGSLDVIPPPSLPSSWRPFLSLLGFLVAISWIATIATEVVSLLKTIGVILDISDSLLGLTVFAVGNSLGDLVADITVARLGYPVMALSACFGGPMLNILLGIGLGGLYMTLNGGKTRRHDEILGRAVSSKPVSYEIAISKVLVISGATLLMVLVGLLIVVPLNGWRMDRKIGWGLIAVWCVSTLGNVIAEIVI
ncbi:Sodium/calcium exchanger membrane region [Penicillium pulvis]|uniref:Sodium/calcium exchanger membrane region n=1 Tax=Penicillium pulvis TaxID=1562058 RepID=UPI002546898C|nr:Sodium/calcium exchanger membrane region [Penicillium pulvis]KAJ5806225.1 Sodium/calcium exchanger membrane region [Penicillium pulvis]